MPDPVPPSPLTQALASRDVPCNSCGHNLRNNTTDRCPECGSHLRLIVESDRLGRRTWLPAAALTFMAFAAIVASVRHVSVVVEVFSRFRVSFTSPAPVPGVPTAYLPWWWWIDFTVAIGIALGASAAAILAWRAYRRSDRAGLVRALWRGIAVGLILSLQILANALVYLLPKLF